MLFGICRSEADGYRGDARPEPSRPIPTASTPSRSSSTAAISRLEFARALGGLAQDRGNDLLRVKGIVRFADRPDRPAVVQAAQHAMFTPEWLDDWPDDDQRSRLVFIVHDIASRRNPRAFAFAAPRLIGSTALHLHE